MKELRDDEAARRIRARLAQEALDPQAMRALLSLVAEPAPGAAARVRAGLEGRIRRPARRSPLRLGLLGAAALATLLLWPRPAALSLALVEEGTLQPVPGLSLAVAGRGELGGTEAAPRLEWLEGELSVDLDPSAHLDLVIQTREATVRVIGTAFEVDRDALGTRVTVQRGVVGLRCDGVQERPLPAGETATCFPLNAAGLLARARALTREEGREGAVLESIQRGLEDTDADVAVVGELRVMEAETEARMGKPAAALAAARAYLALPVTPRRVSVTRLAAGLALEVEGCTGALSLLEELAATDLEAALRVAECAPDRAADVLERAAGSELDPEQTAHEPLNGDPQ